MGLKDSDGNISYYIYKDGKYTLYKELTFNGMTLQLVLKDAPLGYKKTTFLYDGNKVDSYQEVKVDILKNTYALSDNDITGNQYYLFYAKNVETGKENLYQYDALEKTVQRYNTQVLDMYKGARDTYYMYLLGAILLLGVVIVIFSIILILNGKKNKRKNKIKEVEDTSLEEDTLEDSDLAIKEEVEDEFEEEIKDKKKKKRNK